MSSIMTIYFILAISCLILDYVHVCHILRKDKEISSTNGINIFIFRQSDTSLHSTRDKIWAAEVEDNPFSSRGVKISESLEMFVLMFYVCEKWTPSLCWVWWWWAGGQEASWQSWCRDLVPCSGRGGAGWWGGTQTPPPPPPTSGMGPGCHSSPRGCPGTAHWSSSWHRRCCTGGPSVWNIPVLPLSCSAHSPDHIQPTGLLVVKQLLGRFEMILNRRFQSAYRDGYHKIISRIPINYTDLNIFSTSQESHVSGVTLALEQSLPLEVNESVLPCPGQDPDHLVWDCLVDVENILEEHQRVPVAESKPLSEIFNYNPVLFSVCYMIVDYPTETEDLQRDCFLILLTPEIYELS